MKPKIPWWRWAQWWAIMAPALVVFYVLLMPAWLGIRIVRLVSQARSRKKNRKPRVLRGFGSR